MGKQHKTTTTTTTLITKKQSRRRHLPGRESFEGFGGQHPDREAISLPVRRRHFRRRHSGGVNFGGVTSGFRKRRRCTEAASVTPSPLVFRPTRNQDSRRRRRRRRCRQ